MCQAVRISKKFTALLTLSFYNYKKFDNYFLIYKIIFIFKVYKTLETFDKFYNFLLHLS